VRDPGCDAEVAGLVKGLVCPVDVDVNVERDTGCDAEDAELDAGLVWLV
jgi:hypothetical protein